jgi:hypothetical protein
MLYYLLFPAGRWVDRYSFNTLCTKWKHLGRVIPDNYFSRFSLEILLYSQNFYLCNYNLTSAFALHNFLLAALFYSKIYLLKPKWRLHSNNSP